MRDLAVLFKGNNLQRLLGGLGVTLELSLVSVALSIVLGLLAGVLMTLIPALIVFILFQKQVYAGLASGSVKG